MLGLGLLESGRSEAPVVSRPAPQTLLFLGDSITAGGGYVKLIEAALLAKANAEADSEAEKDPNKFGYRTPYAYYDKVMEVYAKWLLTLDGRGGARVIDVRTPTLARLKESHGGDPIHPNPTGHAIMAEAFLKQWPAIGAGKK